MAHSKTATIVLHFNYYSVLINTHSYYSLRYGTLSLEGLLGLTCQFNYETVALTDINTTSACIDFLREAKKHTIRPVVGADIREGINQKFVALAKNNTGFHALNNFITHYLINNNFQNTCVETLKDCSIIYPFNKNNIPPNLKENEYLGVRVSDLVYIKIHQVDRRKMVILQTSTFHNNRSHNIHKLLRAIDKNTVLSKLKDEDIANYNNRFISQSDLLKAFEYYPDIIANTEGLLSQCDVSFDMTPDPVNQNLKQFGNDETADFEYLKRLAYNGIKDRYKKVDDALLDRIESELTMIKQKGFVSYFLINWDIVNYAKQKGYFHVGRGSGANSLIAYLLEITDVDPIELNLYFERFINLHRSSPPDFDIDFSWRDREDVTEYIFNRYQNVALVGTRNTFQKKGTERELGKVFGLSDNEISLVHHTELANAKLVLDETAQLVKKYAAYIIDFPSYLSVHACGIVISDKPLTYFTSTFLPPKGYPTLQFDMHTAEDIGLNKFDILSQRGLGKIKDAIAIIETNRNELVFDKAHDIVTLKEDENINSLIREADAIGCFYVESPAMRMLLKKLRVDNYLGLVAASSIIRPGVAKSGMMRAYIERFRHSEKRKDALPIMLDIMPETYGIMVYQEDVLKVAHTFGGLDLGQADVLRRGMAGKFRKRETFQIVKDLFFSNAIAKGYTPESVNEVWRQIESFAGYAFAKGHSASYAVESYQALFLKAYYPLEYMVATVNNGGGFYRSEVYFIEIKKKGGRIHAPCINKSDTKTLIFGIDIYMGLGFIH
ncbi:MAG: PHP domain-containing protein, partial [Crocinitomicaceae bacterium]